MYITHMAQKIVAKHNKNKKVITTEKIYQSGVLCRDHNKNII